MIEKTSFIMLDFEQYLFVQLTRNKRLSFKLLFPVALLLKF